MMATDNRKLYWLAVYDPETGIATRVVGVVGTEDGDRQLSWMPLDNGAHQWAAALETGEFADMMAVDVEAAATVADGIVLGFIEVDDPPTSPDLAGAVEAAIDLALTASIQTTRGD